MKSTEILFWQQHADDGSLMSAIEADKERAIRFFGVEAVFTRDELALFSLLEAHQIVVRSDRSILADINRLPKRIVASCYTGMSLKESKLVKKQSLKTLRDVVQLKKMARQRLKRALGRIDRM